MNNKSLLALLLTIAIIVLAGIITAYRFVLANNISTNKDSPYELKIPTGSNFDQIIELLNKDKVIKNISSFSLIARKMNYPNHIYPGRYLVPDGMSNISLIRKLRSGKQDPVRLTLNNIDSRLELVNLVASKLECNAAELEALLNNDSFLASHGLNKENALSAVISNTYEFYWNTSAEQFMERMFRENEKFWEGKRKRKAEKLKLTPIEVVILASIVQKESNKKDEYPLISGVYVNRLNAKWPLQADPTVKFAIGQPGLKRILKVHLQYPSPYNTYLNLGLPPGPICLPEIYAIDGVLNAEQHGYMYFCARDDFSGYHAFASTLEEHNLNARRYQQALNAKKIF